MNLFTMLALSLDNLPDVLLHTLWQGTVIAGIAWAVLRFLPTTLAASRYATALGALLLIVLAALFTGYALEFESPDVKPAEHASPRSGFTDTVFRDSASVSGVDAAKGAQPNAAMSRPSGSGVVEYLLLGWLLGVVLMLLRLLRLVHGVHYLKVHSQPLQDRSFETMVADLKGAMRVAQRVSVRTSSVIAGPIAMGLFWPMVLVPAHMVSGLPPDWLRALLAHELAHVRRYDYLVNFLQLLLESLLFFNPSVWWLSRQVRIEREACCDASAARYMQNAMVYSEALAGVARHVNAFACQNPMVSGSHGAEHGLIMDRIARLLAPEQAPRCRLQWLSAIVVILLAATALTVASHGAKWSVSVAARILSDEAHREEVASTVRAHHNPTLHSMAQHNSIEISGTVTANHGREAPVSGPYLLYLKERHDSTASGTSMIHNGRFVFTASRASMLTLTAVAPGYAPSTKGPFHVSADQPPSPIELTLTPAPPLSIRFLDDAHTPLEDIELQVEYLSPDKGKRLGTLTCRSDGDGRIVLSQGTPPWALTLTASAPGYRTDRKSAFVLQAGEEHFWRLAPDKGVSGRVIDKQSKAPIEGATVRLRSSRRENHYHVYDRHKPIATTDEQGGFVLYSLAHDEQYEFLVHAPGYGAAYFTHPLRDARGLIVPMAPRFVRGTLQGDMIAQLRASPLSATVLLPTGNSHLDIHDYGIVDLFLDQGHLSFMLEDLPAGLLMLSIGHESFHLQLDESIEALPLVFMDRHRLPERTVIIHFTTPENLLLDGVSLQVEESITTMLPLNTEVEHRYRRVHEAEIRNGFAEIRVNTPTHITVACEDMAGWFPQPDMADSYEIDDGDEPHVISIPLERAGAISGQVLDNTGEPVPYLSLVASVIGPYDGSLHRRHYGGLKSTSTDLEGRFLFSPVPLETDILIRFRYEDEYRRRRVRLTKTTPVEMLLVDFRTGQFR